ncbi:MAG: hypothetical protein ACKOB9_07205 [Solirubrobacterales bacterium]
MRRATVLAVAFVFLLGFFGVTIYAAIDRGFTILTVISLLVVGIMAIGIFGALGSTYDED